ncbi:hypothetical protein GQ44DRAFT_772019 [Phaeosphaeriaceae sp. PMI808]|nr:hypothetical protein GQ44DRAFT_772019 [Phaeosphaeriaceae sp. PMI808]
MDSVATDRHSNPAPSISAQQDNTTGALSVPYFQQASDLSDNANANRLSPFGLYIPLSGYAHLTLDMLRTNLEEQQASMSLDLYTLISQVCDCCEELWDVPLDSHEFRSRLRYRLEHHSTRKPMLAIEWIRIFKLRPDYLQGTPLEIQQEFRASQINCQQTAAGTMQVSLISEIREREEESRKMWDSSIADRNERVGWHPETDLSAVAIERLRQQAIDIQRTVVLPPSSPSNPSKSSIVRTTAPVALASVTAITPTLVAAQSLPIPQLVFPPMPTGLRRGLPPRGTVSVTHYEWSDGLKRTCLEITHVGQPLPVLATTHHWNEYSSRCTSIHADIRILGGIQITAVELLVFFPEHTQWRAICLRLNQGGWSARKARHLIFWSRQLTLDRALQRTTLQHQYRKALEYNCAPADWSMGGIDPKHARKGQGEQSQLADYFLVALAEGVVHFPQGPDRGILTVAIEHALRRRDYNVRLSDFPTYVQSRGLVQPSDIPAISSSVIAADQEASDRLTSEEPESEIIAWWRQGGFSDK